MQIVCAKHLGFCSGVQRAYETAKSIYGEGVYLLGELCHNKSVNDEIIALGTTVANSIDEIPDGSKMLIRSHGVGEDVYRLAQEKKLEITDCTCPFVKKIHKIVKEYYDKGYKIVIFGKENHPEVKGINGWCRNEGIIISSSEQTFEPEKGEKYCVVAQTTTKIENFEKFLKNIVEIDKKTVEIFQTICYTTIERQEEAKNIAKKCDSVVVIGGENSSNTNELLRLSCEYNQNVFALTNPDCFEYGKLNNYKKVGVLSGASTPMSHITEVVFKMENSATEVKQNLMEDEMTRLEEAKRFRKGQSVVTTISSATDEGLLVYIEGTKKEILLPASELIKQPYNKSDYDEKIGEAIRVMITDRDPVKLSEKAIESQLAEEKLIDEIEGGKIFEAVCDGANKGGLTAKLGSYQIFVPSSQIRIGFVKELDKYVGKTLRLKAEKVERAERRRQIVASQRVILEDERAKRDAERKQKEDAFFAAIVVGDVVRGTPVRFAQFGAFVDVNGFDCLAHISDLSWSNVKTPADVLELNKEYEFKILSIDPEKKKVSVGYKQLQQKPWELVADKYQIGQVVTGKVVRLTKFGAFVEVEKGIDGLVHVSQISHQWLEDPTALLTVGQEVECKILNVDAEAERMTLSIKALQEVPENLERPQRNKPPKKDGESGEKTERPIRNKRAPREKADDGEVREWNEGGDGGASIAELLNK